MSLLQPITELPPFNGTTFRKRESVSAKTKGWHSMTRGKKELAEQIIPKLGVAQLDRSPVWKRCPVW